MKLSELQIKNLARFANSQPYKLLIKPKLTEIKEKVAYERREYPDQFKAAEAEIVRTTTLNVIEQIERYVEKAEDKASKIMKSKQDN